MGIREELSRRARRCCGAMFIWSAFNVKSLTQPVSDREHDKMTRGSLNICKEMWRKSTKPKTLEHFLKNENTFLSNKQRYICVIPLIQCRFLLLSKMVDDLWKPSLMCISYWIHLCLFTHIMYRTKHPFIYIFLDITLSCSVELSWLRLSTLLWNWTRLRLFWPSPHTIANPNRKWRRQNLSHGSANLSKVYYPIKWAHVA